MWSCGVIMYLLITGRLPFKGQSKEETMEAVKKKEVDYSDECWKTVGAEGRELVTRLLDRNPATRLKSHEALVHPWFNKFSSQARDEAIIHPLRNLKNFKAQCVLQKAVLTYIASQLSDPNEELKYSAMFKVIDKSKSGQVTEKDLYEGFMKVYNNEGLAKQESTHVLRKADINGNGVIDYTEFLIANMSQDKQLNEQILQKAFDFYDEDQNGYITIDELKSVFGSLYTEKEIRNIMGEVDLNGDNRICFSEFKKMMSAELSKSKLKSAWSVM
eukprot:TRINITY_DN4475_c0_g1_i13.p1 TRINITY_DN4475_c0_g1~~TRINITY_DN4475_c0_g1_i13.p1  ORF type:complete len:273 (+),score=93.35 TRINITY_DN4475_c0_g1_i13:815-1633(+)